METKIVHYTPKVKSKEEVTKDLITWMEVSRLLSGGNGIRRDNYPKKHDYPILMLEMAVYGVVEKWIELGLIENVE